MTKEEFLYQYLVIYNEYEKRFGNKDAVNYWKKKDSHEGTSGLMFMVLRNALVHNTVETISKLGEINSFNEIIDSLKSCTLKSEDKIKYMSIFFDNEKVKSDLKDKKYELINTTREDIFKLYQRKEEEFSSSIFFSHRNLLFDIGISTYNHLQGCKEYFNDYYIESELLEDEYLIKFFKNESSVFVHKIEIYIDKYFNSKKKIKA